MITKDQFQWASDFAMRVLSESTEQWTSWMHCEFEGIQKSDDSAPVYAAISTHQAKAIIFHYCADIERGPKVDAWLKHWTSEPEVDYLNILSPFAQSDEAKIRRLIEYWIKSSDPLDLAGAKVREIVDR